jgi:hypothetical protein
MELEEVMRTLLMEKTFEFRAEFRQNFDVVPEMACSAKTSDVGNAECLGMRSWGTATNLEAGALADFRLQPPCLVQQNCVAKPKVAETYEIGGFLQSLKHSWPSTPKSPTTRRFSRHDSHWQSAVNPTWGRCSTSFKT